MKKFRVIGGFEEWHQYSQIYYAKNENDALAMAEEDLDSDCYGSVFECDGIDSEPFEITDVYEIKSD